MNDAGKGTVRSYVTGFGLSLLLTLGVYWLVERHVISGHALYSHTLLVTAIMSLAVVQLLVQLMFFLHVGRESKPRWNLVALLFAGMVVLIVVLGSIWIMNHLNYNMLPGADQHIINDEGIKPAYK